MSTTSTTDKILGVTMVGVGAIAVIVATIAGQMIVNGWALANLWRWFIVPRFAVAPLTIAQAIGLGLTITLVTRSWQPRDKKDAWPRLVGEFTQPLIYLAVGLIVKRFL